MQSSIPRYFSPVSSPVESYRSEDSPDAMHQGPDATHQGPDAMHQGPWSVAKEQERLSGKHKTKYSVIGSTSDEQERLSPKFTPVQRDLLRRPIAHSTLEFASPDASGGILTDGDTRVKFDTTSVTTQWVADSTCRDRVAFPQPTNFKLHLPRTFRNVTSVTFNQFKMLNTFYDYTQTNENLTMTIHEQNRVKTDTSGNVVNNIITVAIREGNYNLTTLLAEINTQLNAVPVFTNISGGEATFAADFKQTGDYSLNFNPPIGIIYNPQVDGPVFDPATGGNLAPTMSNLIAQYFAPDIVTARRNFTDQEALVAYYYPILKEMLIRPSQAVNIVVNTPQDADNAVYNFQGLDDPLVITMINANIVALDTYRSTQTYATSLINYYNAHSIDRTLRIQIDAVSISPSISSVLLAEKTTLVQQSLVSSGYTNLTTIVAAQNQISTDTLIVQDMYNFMSNLFVAYLGVQLNKYSTTFYSVVPSDAVNNQMLTFNGDAVSATVKAVASTAVPIDSTALSSTFQGAGLWTFSPKVYNYLKLDMSSGHLTDTNFASSFSTISNAAQVLSTTHGYTDLSGSLSPTIIPPDASGNTWQIPAAGYLIIPFKTGYRYDLTIEALPLQTSFRNNQLIYTPQFTTPVQLDPSLLPSFSIENTDISGDGTFTPPTLFLPEQKYYDMNATTTELLFDISAGLVSPIMIGESPTPVYSLTLNIVSLNAAGSLQNPPEELYAPSEFNEQISVFFYRNQTAFLGDAGQPGLESSGNYFATADSSNNAIAFDPSGNSTTFTVVQPVIAGNVYYAIVRYTNPSSDVRPVRVVVAATSTDARTVRHTPTADDFATLPPAQTSSTTTVTNPDSSQFSYDPFPLLAHFYTTTDAGFVSNDVTDYYSRVDGSTTFNDPVSGYTMSSAATSTTPAVSDIVLRNNYLIGDGLNTAVVKDSRQQIYTFHNAAPPVSATTPKNALFSVRLLERYATKYILDSSNLLPGINAPLVGGQSTTQRFAVANIPQYITTADMPTFDSLSNPPSVLPPAGTALARYDDPSGGVTSIIQSGVLGRSFSLPSAGTFTVREFTMKAGIRPATVRGTYSATDLAFEPNRAIKRVRIYNFNDVSGQSVSAIPGISPIFVMDVSFCAVDVTVSSTGPRVQSAHPLGTSDPDSGTYYRFVPDPSGVVVKLTSDYVNTTRYVAIPFDLSNSNVVPWSYAAFTDVPVTPFMNSLAFGDTDTLIDASGVATVWSTLDTKAFDYSICCKFTLDVYQYFDSPVRDLRGYAYYNDVSGTFYTAGDTTIISPPTDPSGSGIPSVKMIMFLYDSSANLIQDIESSYANEKLYIDFDVGSGYNQYSMLFRRRMDPAKTYYIVIRANSPAASFWVTTRFVGSPKMTFGGEFVDDMVTDLATMAPITSTSTSLTTSGVTFARDYVRILKNMNTEFADAGTLTFGSSSTYKGTTFSQITNLATFIQVYRAQYAALKSVSDAFAKAITFANDGLVTYVNTYYSGVLPPGYTSRNRLTDAIPYKIFWKSYLTPKFLAKADNWGLGYNLGFLKVDTPYMISQLGQQLFKLTTESIYLRLNDEFSMNGMAVSEPEDLAISHESNTQLDKYFAQILLNDFGSYTTTMYQTARPLNPAIGKLDVLHFQLVDSFGVALNNNDCNMYATITITEQTKTANIGATLGL